ncbi:uncharacterized protein K02A2.6-like [Culex quinquefasciatus]|uniref:uncharacterized protein K02A2.6-like n=1 Tax=Culex quinquefasciatus TaxID=7176 RepID=UPI0018E32E1B|nr:uncharacterized protein K02A2.6-like [Culex quinquefasciatus]
MPTLESILARLNGSKWFSTIDLTSAFFHVVLDEQSRHLTNFFSGQDMYRFVRLPFGLTNAPDVFKRLSRLTYLPVARTQAEHDSNLRKVLSRLRSHGVRLNEQKCVFRKNSVKFLGFQLSYDGLSVEEDKLKALENFRRPENLQEVKSFLGLINFSERFILKRADKTENLRNLSRSETFYWTDCEEEEFLYLKYEALSSIKKLGYFDCNDKTELFVDASPIGLGAVLVQYNNEGTPRIIACASKALSASEQKNPQSQKEALSIVNQNIADALSRLIDKSQIDEPFDDINEKHVLYALDAAHMNLSWNTIEIASETDEENCAVRSALHTGVWPENLRRYETQSKELRVLGSLVFKSDKIILPLKLRRTAIEIAHQGHVGCGATKKLLRDYFWWPNMSKEAVEFVGKCEACLMVSRKNPPLPLSSRTLPQGPWEILQIDFLTLNGCGSGHFLVIVDMHSRFLQVIEMKTTDCTKTNAALCKAFTTWGLPLIIQSDNGPPFQSQEFTDFWEDKGVRVRKSIPLSAQSNGGVERQNQGIIKSISAAKAEQRNWREALQEYVHVHNTRKEHSRLGVTPFELLVGWKYRGTFPALWETKSSEKVDKEQVAEDDAASKLCSKKFADNSRGAKESDIQPGDRVVISIPQRNKLDPSFSRERYTVLARKGAKVVVRSDCGVQLARNVQDVKRAQDFSVDSESVGDDADDTLTNVPPDARDHNSETEQQENRQPPATNNSSDVRRNLDDSEAAQIPALETLNR